MHTLVFGGSVHSVTNVKVLFPGPWTLLRLKETLESGRLLQYYSSGSYDKLQYMSAYCHSTEVLVVRLSPFLELKFRSMANPSTTITKFITHSNIAPDLSTNVSLFSA